MVKRTEVYAKEAKKRECGGTRKTDNPERNRSAAAVTNKNKTRVHFVGKVFFDVWRVEDEQYGGWDPVALIFLRWFSRGRVCNYGDGRVLEFLIGSSHHQRIPHSTLVASAGKGKGTKRKEGIIVFIWDVRMCVYVCLAAGSSQRQGLPTGC